jgi:hypothetical protein
MITWVRSRDNSDTGAALAALGGGHGALPEKEQQVRADDCIALASRQGSMKP